MDYINWILSPIIYGVLRIGTVVRQYFKYNQSAEHHVDKATILFDNFQTFDITNRLPVNTRITVKDIRNILSDITHEEGPRFLELRYNYNQLKYKIVYDITSDILVKEDESEELFPLHEASDDLSPPSNLLSVTLHGGATDEIEITDTLRKYEGPLSNFHKTHTSGVYEKMCLKTFFTLNDIQYTDITKLEIMTNECNIITITLDNSTIKSTFSDLLNSDE